MSVQWADALGTKALAAHQALVPETRFSATAVGATAFGPALILHCNGSTVLSGATVFEPYRTWGGSVRGRILAQAADPGLVSRFDK